MKPLAFSTISSIKEGDVLKLSCFLYINQQCRIWQMHKEVFFVINFKKRKSVGGFAG
jgi:hypothetical protein